MANEFRLTRDERDRIGIKLVEFAHAHLAISIDKESRGKSLAFAELRTETLNRIEEIVNEGWEQDEATSAGG